MILSLNLKTIPKLLHVSQQYNVSHHKKHGQLKSIPPPDDPFMLVGIDFCGPFKRTPRENLSFHKKMHQDNNPNPNEQQSPQHHTSTSSQYRLLYHQIHIRLIQIVVPNINHVVMIRQIW
ncbi:unnamed protein product, partial [Didymodactylos carnosus]